VARGVDHHPALGVLPHREHVDDADDLLLLQAVELGQDLAPEVVPVEGDGEHLERGGRVEWSHTRIIVARRLGGGIIRAGRGHGSALAAIDTAVAARRRSIPCTVSHAAAAASTAAGTASRPAEPTRSAANRVEVTSRRVPAAIPAAAPA